MKLAEDEVFKYRDMNRNLRVNMIELNSMERLERKLTLQYPALS